MKKNSWILLAALVFPFRLHAAEDGMVSMPKIQPKRTITVKTADEGESLQEDRGFGEKDAEVSMMNLMMVEGSGYEGMDMNAGMSGMKMDSGKDSGHSMHGMKMAAAEPSKAPVPSEKPKESTERYSIERKNESGEAKVGANPVEFTVLDAKTGKPAKGLKIKAEVSMTSMDMGTTTPRVRETSPGTYQVKAVFSMKGPWAVKLSFPDGQDETLSFTAGTAP
jgi:hypothetical protein